MTDTLADEIESLFGQFRSDLSTAHAEICKLQGLDQNSHTWPEWSPQANTLRWIENIAPTILSALRNSERMREALEIANHDLATTHNLRATDLSPDQMNEALNRGVALSDLEWMTDNSRGLEAIRQALQGGGE